MLLFNTDFLLDDPKGFAIFFAAVAIALVMGITFHEFSHAAAANVQGDLTATRLGRLSLNPRRHLDRAGTIMLVLVGFGWGKPVPVNVGNLRNGRLGMALVSFAGPAANLALALGVAMLFRIGLLDSGGVSRSALESFDPGAWASIVGRFAVQLNLVLAAFNLLPIPPLDGGGILAGIAPRQAFPIVRFVQRAGPFILLLLIVWSFVGDRSPLGMIFGPIADVSDALIGR